MGKLHVSQACWLSSTIAARHTPIRQVSLSRMLRSDEISHPKLGIGADEGASPTVPGAFLLFKVGVLSGWSSKSCRSTLNQHRDDILNKDSGLFDGNFLEAKS